MEQTVAEDVLANYADAARTNDIQDNEILETRTADVNDNESLETMTAEVDDNESLETRTTDVDGNESSETRTTDVGDNQTLDLAVGKTVIDLEAISVTDTGVSEVVDLTTESISTVVDLTADDSLCQVSRRARAKRRRQRKTTSPYAKLVGQPLDDSMEIVQDPSSPPSGSAQDVSLQGRGKKITCPVCMDDSDRINREDRHLVSTTCGHIFCDACLQEAVRLQRKCPTCRKKLNNKQFHPIFI